MTSQEPQTPFSANVDEMHETEVIVVSTPAPVFVDSTGRRSRVLRRLAYGFGALCMLYGGLVSVSLAGGPVSSSAVLPLPDLHGEPDQQVAEERPAPPTTAPAATPSPRPVFATEALPRRPVSATSSLRPGAPRPPAAAATRTPSATPTRKSPTPSTTTTKKPVESGVTKTPTPIDTPGSTGTPAPTDPPVKAPAGGGAGGAGGGAGGGTGTTNSGGTGGGATTSGGTGGGTPSSGGTGAGGTVDNASTDRNEPHAEAPAASSADEAAA